VTSSLANDLARTLVRSADAQDRGDVANIDDGFDEFERRVSEADVPVDVTTAFEFWAGWIDARNHDWHYYEPIGKDDWPSLARRLAPYLQRGEPIPRDRFLDQFIPRSAATPEPASRTLGHYLLLVVSLVFAAEFLLFFVAALTNAGLNPPAGRRYLVLTIAVFLTFVASLTLFVKRTAHPGLCLIGLLLVQPAASALSLMAAGGTADHVVRDVVAAILGVGAFVAAKVSTRARGA
jgi:hypothetical protein